jgi:ABC-type sugar transport system ATPase subunit
MIYVTHDQVEAMTLADRIVVLRAGRIEQIGTPLEVYNHPANLFVAGFIGSPRMNLLPARVAGVGQVSVGRDMRPISVPVPDKAAAGADVTLGARPEHIEIVDEAQADLVVTLDLVEHLGGETYLYGSAPGLPQLTVRQDGQSRYDRGQRLGLRLRREGLHLFDADGNAIRIR